MATKQFGVGYPAATVPLAGTELISVVQGGVTKDVDVQKIANLAAGGSPGGATTQVQFNDGGAFGGDAGLVYDKATDTLTAVNVTSTGLVLTKAGAAGGAGVRIPHGAAPSAPVNGDVWTTTAGLFARINGVTVGPFATSAAAAAMSWVASSIVAGAAATSINVAGLNLSADFSYLVKIRLLNALASAPTVALNYNGDTVAANYARQSFSMSATTTGGTRGTTDGLVLTMQASESAVGDFEIVQDVAGRARAYGKMNTGAAAGIDIRSFSHLWATVANVTSLQLVAQTANAFAIGSRVDVFKVAP